MKRLVFCFDGTWNNLDSGHATNVAITAQCLSSKSSDGTPQVIYYDEGVGTSRHDASPITKTLEKYGGGMFGHGLLSNLIEAYKFLIFNYEPEDEIFVFGFSRGAFSARSFTGLVHACGILRRSHAEHISQAVLNYRTLNPAIQADAEKLNEFRWRYAKDTCVSAEEDLWRCQRFSNDYTSGASALLNIKYLGVWDTVGSLGIPNHWGVSALLNQKYKFHDCKLSRFVQHARHAVAIDEKRKTFSPTLWENLDEVNSQAGFTSNDPKAPYKEVWFPGTHGSVGGGGGVRGLSDEALNWIWRGAKELGLTLDSTDESEIRDLKPDYLASIDNADPNKKPGLMGKLMARLPSMDRLPGPKTLNQVSESARYRWAADPDKLPNKEPYRPQTLKRVEDELNQWVKTELDETNPDQAPEIKALETKSHTVAAGETLGVIAKQYYGDTSYYKKLFLANRPPLTSADEIYPGQILRIPAKETFTDRQQ